MAARGGCAAAPRPSVGVGWGRTQQAATEGGELFDGAKGEEDQVGAADCRVAKRAKYGDEPSAEEALVLGV